MPRNAGGVSLRDKYINLFSFAETTAASSALQSFEYDTGMSPRGGYVWEIHFVEMTFNLTGLAPASGAVQYWQLVLSFVGNESVLPVLSDYGVIWKRIMAAIGNGTSALQYYFEPSTSAIQFARPFLYCKNKLYAYYQSANASAYGFQVRIGYTTKKISGPLLWEAVEQFLSEG